MTTTITFHAPAARDRARVADIVTRAGVFRPDEIPVALEVFDDAVARPRADYWAVGAFEGGELVGYAVFGPVPCTLTTWDLYWVAVDPEARRRGLGRLLMAQCEDMIRDEGGQLVVVETSSRDDYRPAREFYVRLGYDQSATIREYYAPADDLIVYTKDLRASDEGATNG